MPSNPSGRRAVLDYLKTFLAGEITIGNGYINTVASVQRGMRHITDNANADYPALFIMAPIEDRKNLTINQFQSVIHCVIVAIVNNSAGNAGLQGNLDDLLSDVEAALEKDRKLGGKALSLDIKRVRADVSDIDTQAIGIIEVDLMYVKAGITP